MSEWRESAVGLGLVFGTVSGIVISLSKLSENTPTSKR